MTLTRRSAFLRSASFRIRGRRPGFNPALFSSSWYFAGVTAEYEENPHSGYFNFWSGRHPKSAVRTLDFYLAWREGERLPKLHRLPNLTSLIVPLSLLNGGLLDEISQSTARELSIIMGDGGILPDGLFSLDRIETLGLQGNDLTALPDQFFRMRQLLRLDVSHNGLTALPASVTGHPGLIELDISFNEFKVAPRFSLASSLKCLNMNANEFTSLDSDALPRGLEELSVNARLAEIPAGLGDFLSLRKLAIGNPVRELPDLSRLERLVELELAGNLGEALFDQLPTTLEVLRGYGSHRVGLGRVPPGVARLARLRELHLNFEHITEISEELRTIPLESLHLSSTKLGDTATFAALPGTLRCLHLANVGMTQFPERITELTGLRELVLTTNQLTQLPHSLGQLVALERLELDRNLLTKLPEEMGALRQLHTLNLSSNRLTSLPAVVRSLPRLSSLELRGNPIPPGSMRG